MSTDFAGNGTDDEEKLLQQHRKDRKELQAKIQSLKKTICKGDKKKRKDVLEQIAQMEASLNAKQEEELTTFKEKENSKNVDVVEITENIGDLVLKQTEDNNDGIEIAPVSTKSSKMQRRRDKKMAEMKERQKRMMEDDKNSDSAKQVETEIIQRLLKDKGMMIKDVPSDGDCLYGAIRHQLIEKKLPQLTVACLRERTSDVLRSQHYEFLPYMSHPESGRAYSSEEYNEYCDKVANTHEWGTQLELRALSHVLKCGIEVIQASGPALLIGKEYVEDGGALTITFHRHLYQLGAHYNSVTPYEEESKNLDEFSSW